MEMEGRMRSFVLTIRNRITQSKIAQAYFKCAKNKRFAPGAKSNAFLRTNDNGG